MATKTTTTKKVPKKEVTAKTAANLEANVYSQTGAAAGTMKLPEAVFGLKWNQDLVHQVTVSMMANARAGTAHTKDRSEVSGGGKKPWKQKGTGRARHGSSRSPIWIKGGVTFGPRSDKDYSKKINKKMKVKALFTVLSKKLTDGTLFFVDTLSMKEAKTKDAQTMMTKWAGVKGFEKLASKKKTAALLVLPERNELVEKSFRNLPGVTIETAQEMNVLDAVKFNTVIVVGEQAVKVLEAKLK